jgi:hypothetical protein
MMKPSMNTADLLILPTEAAQYAFVYAGAAFRRQNTSIIARHFRTRDNLSLSANVLSARSNAERNGILDNRCDGRCPSVRIDPPNFNRRCT